MACANAHPFRPFTIPGSGLACCHPSCWLYHRTHQLVGGLTSAETTSLIPFTLLLFLPRFLLYLFSSQPPIGAGPSPWLSSSLKTTNLWLAFSVRDLHICALCQLSPVVRLIFRPIVPIIVFPSYSFHVGWRDFSPAISQNMTAVAPTKLRKTQQLWLNRSP